MANQITNGPNQYDFGLDFDYSVWTTNTEVDLINVPWNSDYRDIVRFASKNARDSWMDSKASTGVKIEHLSYVKANEPVRVNIPFNRALKYNYLRASNPLQPVPNDEIRVFFYFILDVRYIAPFTTELVLQLDVWQTYNFDVTFGSCYVERGHAGVANANRFNNYGRDYLTVPEGLDIGSEYRVIAKRTEEIMGLNNATLQTDIDILVFSTINLDESVYSDGFGTEDDPHILMSSGSTINSMPSAAGAYIFPSTNAFSSWLFSMREYPWITQGIISVTAVPKFTRYKSDFAYTTAPQKTNFNPTPRKLNMQSAWRNNGDIAGAIPSRYATVKDKFFTSPYMVIEITAWAATPVVIRPEAWNTPDAELLERINYMPPNQRVQFIPRRYNSDGRAPENYGNLTVAQLQAITAPLVAANLMTQADADAWVSRMTAIGDDFGEYLDIMTQVADFPSLPVLNDMAISYMASNAHSIAYQRQSAGWTQQRALQGNRVDYDQARSGIAANIEQNQNTNRASTNITNTQNESAIAQSGLNALSGIGAGASGGAFAGPIGAGLGAAGGAVHGAAGIGNAMIQANAAAAATALGVEASRSNAQVGARQGQFVADTNKQLHDWAARGDYANAIAGINAMVQDAQMIQPSISGQFGGDAMNVAYGTMELSVRWKFIDAANIRVVGEYWLRYGYAIRAFMNMPSNFMVMSKFTYWKLAETYIIAAGIPEAFKQAIRGIFEKGVTVWAAPEYIGQTDFADNTPVGGFSY